MFSTFPATTISPQESGRSRLSHRPPRPYEHGFCRDSASAVVLHHSLHLPRCSGLVFGTPSTLTSGGEQRQRKGLYASVRKRARSCGSRSTYCGFTPCGRMVWLIPLAVCGPTSTHHHGPATSDEIGYARGADRSELAEGRSDRPRWLLTHPPALLELGQLEAALAETRAAQALLNDAELPPTSGLYSPRRWLMGTGTRSPSGACRSCNASCVAGPVQRSGCAG